MAKKFRVVAITLKEANAFVEKHHRHHRAVVGHKHSLAAVDLKEQIIGIAIIGRPVSRFRDDGMTLEITRLCTDGTKGACSFLLGACSRYAAAAGYRRIGTYTLKEEGGSSLKGAGYKLISTSPGRSWSVPSRPRIDTHPLGEKLLWESPL